MQGAGRPLAAAEMLAGARLDYFSSAKQSWVPVRVTKVDPESGAVEIDLRQGHWIGRQDQQSKLRRHLKPGKAQLEWARAVMGSDQYTEEMEDIFYRHAKETVGPGCEPAVPWSAMSALAAELDVGLGACGSILLLEEEAKPQPKRSEPAAVEAFSLAGFACAFWKLLRSVLREHGHGLAYKRGTSCKGERCGADYEVEKELKAGAFGQVRLVREKSSRRRLAVKSISKAYMTGAEEQLEMEVECLCLVDHPNIVRLHKYYEDAEHVHLVMDFCSGGDLADCCRRASAQKAPFSQAFLAHVMLQLMRAVAHVHARGLVHLDIKGLNVMLTHRTAATMPPVAAAGAGAGAGACREDRDMPHVMLIDLGVAQLFQPGNYMQGFPGGTPSTMAPETWRGEVTPAADVFSCGVVFWELCTLHLDPLGLRLSGTVDDYIRQALRYWERGPDLQWTRFGHLPRAAEGLCRNMLQRARRDRFSAQACVDSAFLGHTSGGSRSLSPADPKVAELIKKLSRCHLRSVLYRSVALSVARKWPSNQLPTVQAAFHALEASATGFVDVARAARELEDFGASAPGGPPGGGASGPSGPARRAAALAAARAMDLNRDGLVDWTEFVAASVGLSDPAFEPTLKQKFQKADADADGLLSRRDLATLLPGCTADDAQVVEMYKHLSRGSSGVDWPAFRDHFRAHDAGTGLPYGGADHLLLGETVPCGAPRQAPRRPQPFDDPPHVRTAMLSL